MNAAEKNILFIAFALFLVGCVVRILPWGLPSIEQREDLAVSSEITDKVISNRGNRQIESRGDPQIESRENLQMETLNDEVKIAKRERKSGGRTKKKVAKVSLPIRINSASLEELCALKGVGPKLAEKILEVRDRSGPFKTPEDLKKVPGIGKKKLEGLLQGVIFD